MRSIGQEAKKFDSSSISERMKLERKNLKKIFFALIIYMIIMVIFYLVL